jgi:uncharacterized protein involved in exopolysaccharide biosynthesis
MSRIDDALRRLAQNRRPGGSASGHHEVARFPSPAAVTLEGYRAEGATALVEAPHRPVEPLRKPGRIAPEHIGPQAVGQQRVEQRAPARPAAEPPEPPIDDGTLIDVGLIRDYGFFVLGSLRRHKLIAAATFLLVAGLSVTAAMLWPKTYLAEARLIVQRNDIMAALSNPGRAIPHDADAPTRGAAEAVLSRESLVALVKQTNLLAQWQQRRAPVLRFKDSIMKRLGSVPTDAERLEAVLGLLEQRLTVSPGIDGTLTIAVTWPDRQMAYEIVETAVQNFLDNKRVGESSAISESVAILERYVASKQTEVSATFAELQAEIASRPRRVIPRGTPPPPVRPPALPSSVTAVSPAPTNSSFGIIAPENAARLARVKNALELRRGEMLRLDQAKATQLNDLQARLASALTVYTDDHPTVSSLRQNIASLTADSPQVASLRAEVQSLEREQDQLLAEANPPRPSLPASAGENKPGTPEAVPSRVADPAPAAPLPDTSALGGGADYTSPTSLRLRLELGQLGEIRERLESARIELATSQAGFKYRYGVVRPTQMPRRPVKPNVPMIALAGIIAALGLAVFGAVAADLVRGRVLEPWQVERLIGVPVVLRLSA